MKEKIKNYFLNLLKRLDPTATKTATRTKIGLAVAYFANEIPLEESPL